MRRWTVLVDSKNLGFPMWHMCRWRISKLEDRLSKSQPQKWWLEVEKPTNYWCFFAPIVFLIIFPSWKPNFFHGERSSTQRFEGFGPPKALWLKSQHLPQPPRHLKTPHSNMTKSLEWRKIEKFNQFLQTWLGKNRTLSTNPLLVMLTRNNLFCKWVLG